MLQPKRESLFDADVLLKGTRVDGVYSSDPEINTSATRYDEISFEEVLQKKLGVMDQTAFTMCRENELPIIVFIIQGKRIGTLVKK